VIKHPSYKALTAGAAVLVTGPLLCATPAAAGTPAGPVPPASAARQEALPGLFAPGPDTVVKLSTPTSAPAPVPDRSPLAAADIWITAKNVHHGKQMCGLNMIQEVSGAGPATLTISVSKAVAVQLSTSATISAPYVSAAVGFNVTQTQTVTNTDAYTVPKGKFGVIQAYPLYDLYTFDIVDSRFKARIGTGTARKPVGVCFNTGLQ